MGRVPPTHLPASVPGCSSQRTSERFLAMSDPTALNLHSASHLHLHHSQVLPDTALPACAERGENRGLFVDMSSIGVVYRRCGGTAGIGFRPMVGIFGAADAADRMRAALLIYCHVPIAALHSCDVHDVPFRQEFI